MTAYLMVRADVPETDREAFDQWYATEHLPQAKAAFGALSAERGWSDVDPGIHIALYELSDLAEARRILASAEIKALIAEFDRVWGGRVKRTRDVVGIGQRL